MKQNYNELPNGYLESISRGINAVRQFRGGMTTGNLSREESVARLKTEIGTADAIVIGAGAGFPQQQALLMAANALKSISGILPGSTVSGIFIPAASILSRMQRPAGPGGQGIFTTTVMSLHQNRSIRIC